MAMVIGHRGASANAPENSLEAFARAREDGADGIELDVRLCGTGEVVVFHDRDLLRLANRAACISHLSWTELKGLRLASGAKIPSLPEVFEVCGKDMMINVEIKTDEWWRPALSTLIPAVAGVLRGLPGLERVVLSSFNPLAVCALASALPRIRRGLLFEESGPLWARAEKIAPWLPIQTIHPQNELCTLQKVRRWKQAGYAVNVWTVDDLRRQQELADWGVDGIITNKPAEARENFARIKTQ